MRKEDDDDERSGGNSSAKASSNRLKTRGNGASLHSREIANAVSHMEVVLRFVSARS